MNGFLLDTNVISEVFKPRPHRPVLEFLDSIERQSSFLSVLTLGELRQGAYRRAMRKPRQQNLLGDWVDRVEAEYQDNLLNVTASIADRWALFRADRDRSKIDTLLAATASVHNLTMVTRNVRDFQGLDLAILNPWEA